ncbi:MAG: hypothetical protein Q8O79_08810 [Pseudomonadota bacterium]|nr:hypothetical protein [Pseudomonadota bacterium]
MRTFFILISKLPRLMWGLKRRLGKAQRAQQPVAMLGTLRFAQPTTLAHPPALIAGLALLAYWNAFAGSFQFDDYKVIVDNPAVASLAAWWQSMPGIRPLLKFSYALNRELAHGDAGLFGFHAANLALHVGNALLLLGIARRLLTGRENSGRVALLAALIFAVHPVHSEAVTMISGRSMALMAFFYLGSLLAYLDQRRGWSLAAFAAALAVRETALTLPLALLLVERLRTPDQPFRAALLRGGGHWLLAALAASALLLLPYFRHLAAVSLATRPPLDNLITQSAAVLYLLRQWLWPLALDADPLLPVFSHWNGFWLASTTLSIGLFIGALFAWRKAGGARWIGFGMLWFFLHLAPTNSLLPRLDVANERHLYLASAGLCLLAALWLTRSLQTRPRLLAGVASVLVLGLALTTLARNTVYRDEITFWTDITAKNPGNSRAYNNLGYALARSDRPAAAVAAYNQAIRLDPADFTSRLNRRALCRKAAAQCEKTDTP